MPRLQELGAAKLKLSVVDSAVAAGSGIRITPAGERAKDAFVSFWLEQSQERAAFEDVLRAACDALHGFLVVESCPMVNVQHTAPPGGRTPGFSLVTCIVPRQGLDYDEFVHLWYTKQRDMACETQSTFGYIRNEIVRPLTPDAPDWAAIVEEAFPSGALDDPYVFYDAVGDEERLKANGKRMLDTVALFLALDRVSSHPMSETIFER
jgi:hypothetical protein